MTEVGTSPSATTTPSRTVLYGVVALAAISVGGAVISVAGGLSRTWLAAMGPSGRLSVPLPMIGFQLLAASAAASRRRRVALVGSGLLAVAELTAVTSGFFDGGYADERLTASQRAYQLLLVGGLVVVGAQAATRFTRVWRRA